MVKLIDVLNSNIMELSAAGVPDTNISMPVINKHNDKLCFISFSWSAKGKQRNVPAPEHICITPLQGYASTEVESAPKSKIESVVIARSPTWWMMKKLCGDLDEIVQDYNTTARFPVYKYLSYLENMLPCYSEDYYPLFAVLNNPAWNIDILKEVL